VLEFTIVTGSGGRLLQSYKGIAVSSQYDFTWYPVQLTQNYLEIQIIFKNPSYISYNVSFSSINHCSKSTSYVYFLQTYMFVQASTGLPLKQKTLIGENIPQQVNPSSKSYLLTF